MHGHHFIEIWSSSDVELAGLGVPVVQDDVVGFSSLAAQSSGEGNESDLMATYLFNCTLLPRSEHRRVRRRLI